MNVKEKRRRKKCWQHIYKTWNVWNKKNESINSKNSLSNLFCGNLSLCLYMLLKLSLNFLKTTHRILEILHIFISPLLRFAGNNNLLHINPMKYVYFSWLMFLWLHGNKFKKIASNKIFMKKILQWGFCHAHFSYDVKETQVHKIIDKFAAIVIPPLPSSYIS